MVHLTLASKLERSTLPTSSAVAVKQTLVPAQSKWLLVIPVMANSLLGSDAIHKACVNWQVLLDVALGEGAIKELVTVILLVIPSMTVALTSETHAQVSRSRHIFSTSMYSNAVTCTNGAVRLMGGDDNSGRVEVCINDMWNSICSSGFDDNDARVLCRSANLASSGKCDESF